MSLRTKRQRNQGQVSNIETCPFLIAVILAMTFFTGCQSNNVKGQMSAVDAQSIFSKPVHTVAIFPVQNATGRPVILYSGRASLVERATTSLLDGQKGLALGGANVANPQYVPQLLGGYAGNFFLKKGYEVPNPRLVEREYFRISNQTKEVTPFELSLSIPADAFFVITVTSWDSEDFIPRGAVSAAFDMVLVRANDGATLWKKNVPKRAYVLEAPRNSSFTNHRRQEEMVEMISGHLLRDFPKTVQLNQGLEK